MFPLGSVLLLRHESRHVYGSSATAVAQTVPTVPSQTVIGRTAFGTGTQSTVDLREVIPIDRGGAPGHRAGRPLSSIILIDGHAVFRVLLGPTIPTD
jgi:hypothetical protein